LTLPDFGRKRLTDSVYVKSRPAERHLMLFSSVGS
jgi:hypothetical protein